MKVIKMIKDDCITGVEYGLVEIPDTIIESKKLAANATYQQIQKANMARMRKNNQKHK